MSQSGPVPAPGDPSAVLAEGANQWTHAVGWALSLLGAVLLLQSVTATGDLWRICGCAVYAASLVSVYAASTLSHRVVDDRWRDRFRMLDQVCIFLLVVGSYTAFATAHARDGWLGLMLITMWLIALIGVIARIRSKGESVPILWYVLLGWMPILAVERMLEATGIAGTALAVSGGLAYTAGTWFLANDHKHPLYHAVWHCFTLVGSGLHFVYLYRYVASASVA